MAGISLQGGQLLLRSLRVVVYSLRTENAFGANGLEMASIRVVAHEIPESDLVVQHPVNLVCLFQGHLLPHDRRFGVVYGTIHPSRRTGRHAPVRRRLASRNRGFAKLDAQGTVVIGKIDSPATTNDQRKIAGRIHVRLHIRFPL
jgi:hypothetical protein